MHPNPIYRGADEARNLAFARERGFGALTIAGEAGPLLSHAPFVISEDGGAIGAHIVRSNPIWRALREGPARALLAVSGPDGYISPDWYGIDDQVPTWNYVAVHLRGELRLLDQAALRPHLEALSEEFERRLAPKPVWRIDKMAEEPLARMMRMIVPVSMRIESVEGTWKFSQNKTDAARIAAAEALERTGFGQEVPALAALMRAPPA
ncbi:MAG: FMN-binding negative transcriptional regulator [Pikeienuella sp.]